MPIKQSTLDKRWYYRVAKVLFLWVVPISIVLALLAILYSGAGGVTDAVIFAIALAAYLLILKGVWRGFLYLVFGGLDNDMKKKTVPVVRSASPTVPARTPVNIPTETKANIVAKAIVQAIGWSLILWLGWLILGQFLNSLNSNSSITPSSNTNGGSSPLCSNRCPAYAPWYCTGQYYDADNIQRSFNGCLPTTAAQAGYSSWSGRCTKCP